MALPPGPPSSMVVQTLHWIRRPIELLEECAETYGDCFTLRLWALGPIVMVSHPETIKQVFTAPGDLLRAGEVAAFLRPFVGPNSLLLLDGREHLRQRRLTMPTFHGERMQAYAEVMRDITAADVATWPEREPCAVHPHMQGITLAVILRTVFGMEDGERMKELGERLVDLLEMGRSGVTMLPLMDRYLGPGSPRRRFDRALAVADGLLLAEIERRRAEPPGRRTDVLSMLLAARDEQGRGLTNGELRDELVTLLAAGHETTATALAWTFEQLLSRREVQERLVAEIDAVTGGEPVTDAHLARLDYLDAVIKESLRLRPIIPMVGRRVQVPLMLRGFELPAGTVVAPSIYLTHRNPLVYPAPEQFRPERFLGVKPDPYAWLPFGGGIRRCLGMAFALYEMKIVLATVLQSVALGLAPGASARMRRRSITFAPADGVRVVAVRRPAAAAPRRAHG